MVQLKIYRKHPMVPLPKFATKESACFDIAYCGYGKHDYKGYNKNNSEFRRILSPNGHLCIMPGDRVMIPTGMIFDIPSGYSVRLHPRSGVSLKQGLVLANSEAVIDSDYYDELFLLIVNTTENKVWINNGDRLAQGELVELPKYEIADTLIQPMQRTDRVGGLGSTGVNTPLVYSYQSPQIQVVSSISPIQQNQPVIQQLTEQQQVPQKRGRGRPRKVVTT